VSLQAAQRSGPKIVENKGPEALGIMAATHTSRTAGASSVVRIR